MLYEYRDKRNVHVIQSKMSQTSKLGYEIPVIQTYHYSLAQIKAMDMTKDSSNCLGCPYSHGKNGGCYTHKGQIRQGLQSKLRSMAKRLDDIQEFNLDNWKTFFYKLSYPKLIRFGSYGEAVLMEDVVKDDLFKMVSDRTKVTTYTHAWRKYKDSRFTASVHTIEQAEKAIGYGLGTFLVIDHELTEAEKLFLFQNNFILCPASKEAGKKKTCDECGLCDGRNNVYIGKH